MGDFGCQWFVVCDDRCCILWWCLVLRGGGGNGGGLHWMMVKFGEEDLCLWISNVFLFVTVEDDD
jgi:hypothetical protein